jgi:hypothetical protein
MKRRWTADDVRMNLSRPARRTYAPLLPSLDDQNAARCARLGGQHMHARRASSPRRTARWLWPRARPSCRSARARRARISPAVNAISQFRKPNPISRLWRFYCQLNHESVTEPTIIRSFQTDMCRAVALVVRVSRRNTLFCGSSYSDGPLARHERRV